MSLPSWVTQNPFRRLKASESWVISLLTSLSDAAAESLSYHDGDLEIDLDDLPESAADWLRTHPSFADED